MVPLEYLLNFVSEDAPFGDVTSEAVLDGGDCTARLRFRETGIAAGLTEAEALFAHFGAAGADCLGVCYSGGMGSA